jgi:hypothetical protein
VAFGHATLERFQTTLLLQRVINSDRHREPPLGGVAIHGGAEGISLRLPWIAAALRASQ